MTKKSAKKTTEPEHKPRALMAVTPKPAPRCAACDTVIESRMMGWVDDRPHCDRCTADKRISMSIQLASLSLGLCEIDDREAFWQALGSIGAFMVVYARVLEGEGEAAQTCN